MASAPTIDGGIVKSVVQSITSLGADAERLVESCGLSAIWQDPTQDAFREDRVWKLFEVSANSLQMPDLGLRVGAEFRVRDLGAFGRTLESNLTTFSCLKEYVGTVTRYSSHSQFWLDGKEGGAWFCRRGIELIDVGCNEVEQFTLELMIRLVQLGCGPQWTPRRLRIQQADDSCFRRHPVYDCMETRFGQSVTAIWISDLDLVRMIRLRDDDVTVRVRDHIRLAMRDSVPSISMVAQQLGYSVRSLQRSLSERGIVWSRLLDQARLGHATTLLASDMSILAIAHNLGYTDQANFGRAFRRWTGLTPNNYRRQTDGSGSKTRKFLSEQ